MRAKSVLSTFHNQRNSLMTQSGNQNTVYTMNDEWVNEWFNLPAWYYTQVYMSPFSTGPVLEKYIPQYIHMFPKLHIYNIHVYMYA